MLIFYAIREKGGKGSRGDKGSKGFREGAGGKMPNRQLNPDLRPDLTL
jgi:hypothetical protein